MSPFHVLLLRQYDVMMQKATKLSNFDEFISCLTVTNYELQTNNGNFIQNKRSTNELVIH